MLLIRTFAILAAWVKDLLKETDMKLTYRLEIKHPRKNLGKGLDITYDAFRNPKIKM